MTASTKRQKHIPQRSCVVCREKTDKRRLTRIVRTPDEGVVVDVTGKRAGRGAYLCERAVCWTKAVQAGVLDRALKTTLTEAERELLAAHRRAHQHAKNVEDAV